MKTPFWEEEITRPTQEGIDYKVSHRLPLLMSIKVKEYIRKDGSSSYKTWFDTLDAPVAAKVTTAKLRMELGNLSNIKWFGGIGEYKIDWGPGYRIYLAKDGDKLIVLLGGGTKERQNTAIEQAKELYKEYKTRKKLEASRKKTEESDQSKSGKRKK